MDGQMPGMDGFEATAPDPRARGADARRTPIIAMTASAMKGDRERCLAAGMDDYVAKPVTPDALEAVLRRGCGARDGARRARRGRARRRRASVLDEAVLAEPVSVDDDGTLLDEVIDTFLRIAPVRLAAIGKAAKRQTRRCSSARPTASSAAAATSARGAWPSSARAIEVAGPRRLDRGRPATPRLEDELRRRPCKKALPARTREGVRRLDPPMRTSSAPRRSPLPRPLHLRLPRRGEVPAGPAIVAANHPSYLDPLLLSLQVRRPIRFMAWDALFKVPAARARVLRAFGAFPVDIAPGPGRARPTTRPRLLVDRRRGRRASSRRASARGPAGWSRRCARARRASPSRPGRRSCPRPSPARSGPGPTSRRCPEPARIRVRYHDPIDPARLPRPARGRGDRRRSSPSCAGGWSARCCPGSRPTCASTRSTRAGARGRAGRVGAARSASPCSCSGRRARSRSSWPGYAYIALPARWTSSWSRSAGSPSGSATARPRRSPSSTALQCCEPRAARGRRPAALLALLAGARLPLPLRARTRRHRLRPGARARDALRARRAVPVCRRRSGPHVALPLFCAAYAWESAASSGGTPCRPRRPTRSSSRSGSAGGASSCRTRSRASGRGPSIGCCRAGAGRRAPKRTSPAPPRPRSVCATDAWRADLAPPAFGHTERAPNGS